MHFKSIGGLSLHLKPVLHVHLCRNPSACVQEYTGAETGLKFGLESKSSTPG